MVEVTPDQVKLIFPSMEVIEPGIELGLEVALEKSAARFSITYSIWNHRSTSLPSPYVMVGLPGFLDNRLISSIGTGSGEFREPSAPHRSFEDEALASSYPERRLLQDMLDLSREGELQGIVQMREFGHTYFLVASYGADQEVRYARSAHTNKPRYMTSHLYLYLTDILPGQRRSVTVYYSLYAIPLSSQVRNATWGAVKQGAGR